VIQNGLSNLVATSAGIASYLTLFRVEQNVRISRSGIVFIISKASDLFTTGLILLVSAWLVWDRVGPLHQVVTLLLGIIFVGLCVFWAAIFLRQKFMVQLQRLVNWMRLGHVKLIRTGLDVLQSIADQEHAAIMRTLISGLVISTVYMTVTMAYSYCRVQAFRVPLDFWAVIFIACLIQLVSLIPIQAFGGLGVVEITSVYLYDMFNVVQVDMAAILIGMRVVFYLFNLVILLYLPLEALYRRITGKTPSKPADAA